MDDLPAIDGYPFGFVAGSCYGQGVGRQSLQLVHSFLISLYFPLAGTDGDSL